MNSELLIESAATSILAMFERTRQRIELDKPSTDKLTALVHDCEDKIKVEESASIRLGAYIVKESARAILEDKK